MRGPLDGLGLLFAASKDPDAKVTFVCSEPGGLAAKISTTTGAERAVDQEGRVLVGLRRLGLGALDATVPRYVSSTMTDGRRVLVSTALPGTAMAVPYHHWRHTAHRRTVRRDFALAASWLAEFQSVTARGEQSVGWPAEVAHVLSGRWDGDPLLDRAVSLLANPVAGLSDVVTPTTAVHGDYWLGNLLVDDGAVTGVVDWEAGALAGSPLRDLARFPLSYGLYLDRHVRPGASVPGHRGLHRTGFGAGVSYALLGAGWLPDTVRGFLGDGLVRLGLSRRLWYGVALAGLAEIAGSANDDGFAHAHLELLASLPDRPRGHRRTR